MGQNTGIEWTDHTFNPWWGCTKVSPGCAHCYAETWSLRYGHEIWGPQRSRRTFGQNHWQEPLKWNRTALQQGRRRRVFCASMADVFEDNASIVTERAKLWDLISETPMLDWLLLTKRPENMERMTRWGDMWPFNVWAMTSVENQLQANRRVPTIVNVPAVVRGLSVEPLLGPVNLDKWIGSVQWVIVGGESGPRARPMNPYWVRRLRDQCVEAGVPFFFKQWGEWVPFTTEGVDDASHGANWRIMMNRVGKKAAGRLLDSQIWHQLPDPERPGRVASYR